MHRHRDRRNERKRRDLRKKWQKPPEGAAVKGWTENGNPGETQGDACWLSKAATRRVLRSDISLRASLSACLTQVGTTWQSRNPHQALVCHQGKVWAEMKEQLTREALSRVEVNLVRNPQHRLKEIKFEGQNVSKLGGTLSYVILGVTESCVCVFI